MPSFILRKLDPEFWARVQAKAKAEGITVKARILALLKTWLGAAAAIGVLGILSGCNSHVPPYNFNAPSPVAVPVPTPTPQPPPVVAALTVDLRVSPTTPAVNRVAALVADVRDSQGSVTYAWNFGDGTTLVTSATHAQHTFRAEGIVTASVRVTETSGRTADAAIVVTIREEPEPPPSTEPPASCGTDPTLCATPAVVSATLTCAAGSNTALTDCTVAASDRRGPLPGRSVYGVDVDWGDGTPLDPHYFRPAFSHLYPVSGRYTIFAAVFVTTRDDGNQRVDVTEVVVIP